MPDRHKPDLDPAPEPAPAGPTPSHSLWALKPWWCQPWSILLTGALVIGASWLLWHRWWLTAPAAAAVLLWWWLFLVLAPRAYSQSQTMGNIGNP
ncbi:MAG: DUF6737 family protein [Prochlorococcaceae cyanobacterium]